MLYASFPLASVFEVMGQDSQRYLNSRLTNDLLKLAPGSGLQAAALSAQGKTQGLFTVCRLEERKFMLVCDGGEAGRVFAALKQFIIADRVSVLANTEHFKLFHVYSHGPQFSEQIPLLRSAWTALQPLQEEFSWTQIEHGFIIRRSRGAEPGYDVLISAGVASQFTSELKNCAAREAESSLRQLMRLKAARPEFPTEINDSRLFPESGLVSAVSFKKGCYVGQEVVSKLDSVGKLAQVLSLLKLEANVALLPDAVVSWGSGEDQPGEPIGKVLSFASDAEANLTWCFAAVRNDSHIQSGMPVTVNRIPGMIEKIIPPIVGGG